MGNIYSALKKELKNKQREEERRRKEEEKAKQVFLTNLLDPQLKCTLGNVINNLAGSSSHHQPSVTVFAPWPVSHKSNLHTCDLLEMVSGSNEKPLAKNPQKAVETQFMNSPQKAKLTMNV